VGLGQSSEECVAGVGRVGALGRGAGCWRGTEVLGLFRWAVPGGARVLGRCWRAGIGTGGRLGRGVELLAEGRDQWLERQPVGLPDGGWGWPRGGRP